MAKSSNSPSYEAYLIGFYERQRQFEQYNLMHPNKPKTFYDPDPLSRTQFLTTYKGERNRRKEEVALGKRKSVGNITRAIIETQAYEITSRQAKAFVEAAKQTLIEKNRRKRKKNRIDESKIRAPISVTEARINPEAAKKLIDFRLVTKKYKELRESGYSVGEARTEISHRWFGS